jgi:predicted RND superfamily exporter protein
VHLVNYYVASPREGTETGRAVRALRQGWLPCTLSAGTTAIGLASLLVSRILPVRNFGWYGALGVLITLGLLLLIVPGACEWSHFVTRKWRWLEPNNGPERKRRVRGNRFPRFPLRYPRTVLVVCLTAMLFAGLGLPALETTVRIDSLFHRRSQLIRDYEWIERHVGPLVPLEVVLRFDPESALPLGGRLDLVRQMEESLAAVPQVGGTMSAATFLPPAERGGTVGATVRRRLTERRIERQKDRLVELGYLKQTDAGELWRVTGRVGTLQNLPYEQLVDHIYEEAARITAGVDAANGVAVTVTGITPLVHRIQTELMRDLIASFLCALTLIVLVMMLAQRSIVLGLAAMIPNVFPVVMIFGVLGWLRIHVDIGSVMTASLALGMAIDGTQHFVTFFRQGLSEGQSVERSVTAAYRHCSKAILIGALVCGLGLVTFVFSPFEAVSRCAMIICVALLAMTVGDLVLLPAILMLTGRQFLGRRKLLSGMARRP